MRGWACAALGAGRGGQARGDSLYFQAAAPFAEATAVAGRLSATLTVRSTAVDTDFYVTLTDRYPADPETGAAGPTVNVRYGAAKMRWNTPGATPEAAVNMVPGETYEVRRLFSVELAQGNWPEVRRPSQSTPPRNLTIKAPKSAVG